MREILFRGKRIRPDKDTGEIEWVYGHYMTVYGVPNIELEDGRECDVAPESIGEYCGICDKNGTKIFEGDIVKTHYANTNITEFTETVVFEGGAFRAKKKYPDNSSHSAPLYNGTPHLQIDKSAYMDSIEVIGNIHDNTELLKEGE